MCKDKESLKWFESEGRTDMEADKEKRSDMHVDAVGRNQFLVITD